MQSLNSSHQQSWLVWFYKGILLLGIFILVGRLIEVQIIKGKYYQTLAENNRLRHIPITAPRGKILDRNGQILVDNLKEKFIMDFSPAQGFLKKPIDNESDIPEADLTTSWKRKYPFAETFAHVSGFLGEVNPDEVNKVDPHCPQKGVNTLGTLVGRLGLEKQYDCQLKGIDGEELVEVDTFGNKIRTFGRRNPIPGSDLTTTIDLGLQKILATHLAGHSAAAIITTVDSEILALHSSPSYDPGLFTSSHDSSTNKEITNIFSDPTLPMFNRVISGTFHPGSIFKLVTATAALEEHAIKDDFRYEDTGSIKINEFTYNNWYFTQYGQVEGLIDLPKALSRSTDTFFYKVGEHAGIDNLVAWAKKFGLSQPTGIDLPGEVGGLIPSPDWKRATKGENWYLGNTYHFAIGQGDISITPIETHLIASVIATNGKLCTPFLNKEQKVSCQNLNISPKTINLIKQGMVRACSPGGTAYPFFDFVAKTDKPPIGQAACKTGTAETFEEDITHAWFTVFAPADNPEIIATFLIEKGGEGSKIAAPIARDILDYWFLHKNYQNN